MAFQDKIQIAIESIFDSEGFDKMQSQIKQTQKSLGGLENAFQRARGIANMRKQSRKMTDALSETRFEFQRLEDMDMSRKQAMAGFGGSNLRDQVEEFGGVFRTAQGDIAQTTDVMEALTNQADRAGAMISKGFSENVGATNPRLEELRENTGQTNTVLSNLNFSFMEGNGLVQNFRDRIGNMGQAFKTSGDQAQGFRFELLGVMFAGMALQRVSMGLLRPALKAAGVFDLWSSILKILFLPVALEVLDAMMGILNWVQGLSESQKKLVGFATMGAVALGFLGLMLGQVGLAVQSINLLLPAQITLGSIAAGVWSTMAGAISGAAAAVAGFLGITVGSLLIILAAIVGAVVLLNEAWANNWLGIRQIVGEAVKFIGDNLHHLVNGALLGMVGALDLVIKTVNKLFNKDWDTLSDKMKQVGSSMSDVGDDIIESGEKIDKGEKQGKGLFGFKLTGKGGMFGESGEASMQQGLVAGMLGPLGLSGLAPSSNFYNKPGSPTRPNTSNPQGTNNTIQMIQNNDFKGTWNESKKDMERESRRIGEKATRTAQSFNTR